MRFFWNKISIHWPFFPAIIGVTYSLRNLFGGFIAGDRDGEYFAVRMHEIFQLVKTSNFLPAVAESELYFTGPSLMHMPMRVFYVVLLSPFIPSESSAAEVMNYVHLFCAYLSFALTYFLSAKVMEQNKDFRLSAILAFAVSLCPGILSLLYKEGAFLSYSAFPWSILTIHYVSKICAKKSTNLDCLKGGLVFCALFATHPAISTIILMSVAFAFLWEFLWDSKNLDFVKKIILFALASLLFSFHQMYMFVNAGGSYSATRLNVASCSQVAAAKNFANQAYEIGLGAFKIFKYPPGTAYPYQPGFLVLFLFVLIAIAIFKGRRLKEISLGALFPPGIALFLGKLAFLFWLLVPCKLIDLYHKIDFRMYHPLIASLPFVFSRLVALNLIRFKKYIGVVFLVLCAWTLYQADFLVFLGSKNPRDLYNPSQYLNPDTAFSYDIGNSGKRYPDRSILDARWFNSILSESGEEVLSNLEYLKTHGKAWELALGEEEIIKGNKWVKFDFTTYLGKNLILELKQQASECFTYKLQDSKRLHVFTPSGFQYLAFKSIGEKAFFSYLKSTSDKCANKEINLRYKEYEFSDYPIKVQGFYPLRISYNAPHDGLVLESFRMHLPVYSAKVNGIDRPVVKTPSKNLGVALAKGENVIEFKATPPSWYKLSWMLYWILFLLIFLLPPSKKLFLRLSSKS